MKKLYEILHNIRNFIPDCYTWLIMREIKKGRTFEQLEAIPFFVIVGKWLLLFYGLRIYRKFNWCWYYEYAEDLADYEESPFGWVTLP